MKKNVFGRQFKRDVNERKALFKNLLTSLVLEERITTTEAKAKAIKGAADKLVTKAKKGGDGAYRAIHPDVNQKAVVKLIEEIAPRFTGRAGGYTRIIRVGKRRVADNAPMVMIEWTENAVGVNLKLKTKNLKEDKREVKDKNVNKDIQVQPVVAGKKPEAKIKVREVAKKLVTRQKKGQ